jgi:hypothetical protein
LQFLSVEGGKMNIRFVIILFVLAALAILAPEEGHSETKIKSRMVASWSSAFSEKTQLWVMGLPQPSKPEEKDFLKLLAKVHESPQSYDELMIQEMAQAFVKSSASFGGYMTSVLEMMSPVTDQREKNFIYRFAQTALPKLPLSSYVIQDVHIMFRSGTPTSQDSQNLSDILSSQNDIPKDEKDELLEQYGISHLPKH